MTDRYVTFSAPMVRALRQGRKTQTRRLATSPLRRCEIGDRLVVREHWKTMALHDKLSPTALGEKWRKSAYPAKEGATPILYLADDVRRGEWADDERDAWCPGRHRQGMHMPRWASRMTLVITGVRVEPLQAISDEDAIAEGVHLRNAEHDAATWTVEMPDPDRVVISNFPSPVYRTLWDALHTDEGQRWQDNPDVLVLTFDVRQTNIDNVEKQ